MINRVFEDSFREAEIRLAEYISTPSTIESLVALASRIEQSFKSGGKVLIAGNGGSMSDAVHFAEEWTGRFRNERRPYPAMALSDAAHLSCVANDYGFDFVFSRMVEAFAKPEDVLILLSTSGKSPNLLHAARAGRSAGCHVAAFLGRGGGPLLPLCDSVIIAPGITSDRIQELHMLSLHILIEAVEALLEQSNDA